MLENMEKVYLFGDNEDNRKIYNSIGLREGIILDRSSGISLDVQVEKIVNEAKNTTRRNVVVVNMEDEEQNVCVCKSFALQIAAATTEEKDVLFHNLRISAFVDVNHQAAYQEVIDGAYGCIAYVDKYQQIAMDFIEHYPFAKFMDERHVDYQTSLIRKDVNINVVMLGFGKTNRQIFFTVKI